MSKKVLLIIGIIIIIGIAVFLVLSSSSPVGEGETRVGFSIRDYFPFGKGEDLGTSTNQNINTQKEEPTTTNTENKPVPRLRKISSEPVAGAVVFNVGTTTFARFVEKGTGNVYEARSDSNTIERLTNTTIPKIVRAEWLPNAGGFLAQRIDIGENLIATSFVKLNKNKTNREDSALYDTVISKLPTGIEELAISPDSSKIFYYLKGASSFWFTAKPDGTSKSYIYTSPILEWVPIWIDNKNVFMSTKPSTSVKTFAYNFNIESKTLTKTSVDGFGLSFNPKNNVSLVSNGGFNISVINNKTLESTDLKTNTLSDKCVWLEKYVYCAIPEGNISGYMDSWYKGTTSTQDNIRKVDTENLFYTNISSLSTESGEDIDVENMGVSGDESHLIFRNKRDEFLWMLRVEN